MPEEQSNPPAQEGKAPEAAPAKKRGPTKQQLRERLSKLESKGSVNMSDAKAIRELRRKIREA